MELEKSGSHDNKWERKKGGTNILIYVLFSSNFTTLNNYTIRRGEMKKKHITRGKENDIMYLIYYGIKKRGKNTI